MGDRHGSAAILNIMLCWIACTVVLWGGEARGAITLVQEKTRTARATSITARFDSTPTENNLLVAIAATQDSTTISAPAGWQSAINQSGSPGQAIFYTIAAASQSSNVTVSTGSRVRLGLHIYEFSGVAVSSPLDQVGSATGSGASVSSGSLTTTTANALLLAGLVSNVRDRFSSWSNSFQEENDFRDRSTFGSAIRVVSSTGTYSTTASIGSSGDWRGQIVAFKEESGGGTLVEEGSATADKTLAQGTFNNAAGTFTLSSLSGTDTLTGLTVTLSGTGSASDLATNGVKIYEDNGSIANEWDVGDSLIGSASMIGSSAVFSGLNIVVDTSPSQYLITYDIAADATNLVTLAGAVSAAGAAINNPPSVSDSPEAMLTISNGLCDIDPNGTSIETEHFSGTIGGSANTFVVQSSQADFLGEGYLLSSGGGAGNCPPDSDNEGKEYTVNFPASGRYFIWMRGYATGNSDDSLFIGLDGSCAGGLNEGGVYDQWVWSNGTQTGNNYVDVAAAGVHTLNIWVRENGHLADTLYITQGSETPTDLSHGIELDPTVCAAPTTIIGDGTAPADKTVQPGSTGNAVSVFTLSTTTGSDILTALTVTLSGSGSDADLTPDGVKIYRDSGSTANEWDSSDTLVASTSMSGTTAIFSGLSIAVDTTPLQYLIVYEIADSATSFATLLAEVSAGAATTNDPPLDRDSIDATLTVAGDACSVNPNGTYIDAEGFSGTFGGSVNTFTVETSQAGSLGSGYLKSNGGATGSCPPSADSEGKEYLVNFPTIGRYFVWMRGYAFNGSSDSLFIGLDGSCAGALNEGGVRNQWVWSNSIQNGTNYIDVATAGWHTVTIWVREKDHLLDGLYLTQGGETPTDLSHGTELLPSACSVAPIADYRLDNCTVYDGTAGEVLDSSGNNRHGSSRGAPGPADNGIICRTAAFNGTDTSLDLGNEAALQLSDGAVTAWINTADAGAAYRGIVVKESAYGLFLVDNVLAIYDWGSGSSRSTGITMNDGSWHHVALSFQSGVVNGTTLFIDGVARLTTTMTVSNQAASLVVGAGNSAGSTQNFNGTIDEVKVYSSLLSESQVQSLYSNESGGSNYDGSSRACGECSCTLGSFQLEADQYGLACPQSRAAVQITALCDDGVTVKNDYLGTAQLTDSPANGDFYTAGSGGSPISSFAFAEDDNGSATVYYSFPDENPSVTLTADDGGSSGSDTIDFNAYGFQVESIADQSSCSDSATYQVQAIGQQTGEPGCDLLSGFSGSYNLKASFDYVAPSTNPAATQVMLTGSGGPQPLPTSVPGMANITLDFVNGQAPFTFSYADAGQLRLRFQYDQDPYDGDPHGAMTGLSNDFTVRPDHFRLAATKTDGVTVLDATTASATPTLAAGADFRLTLQAVCADESLTPNYQPGTAQLWVERSGPTTNGSEGNLTLKATSFATSLAASPSWNSINALFSDGQIADSGQSYVTAGYSEVGLIRLHIRDSGYFGSSIPEATLDIGRFRPATLGAVASFGTPALENSCATGFTYLGQDFTYDSSPVTPQITVSGLHSDGSTVTQNYEGDYWKLDSSLTLNYTDSSGASPSLTPTSATLAFADTSNGNGSGVVELSTNFSYSRPASESPVEPFAASIDLSVPQSGSGGLTDSDGVCFDTGSGCQTLSETGLGGASLRHGRIMVANNFGPETEDITASPFEIQYWGDFDLDSDFEWAVNSDEDSMLCTAEADLAFCAEPASHSVTLDSGSLQQGAGAITVTAASPAVEETVLVCPTGPAVLSSLSNCSADNQKCGRLTFGIYRGNDRIINWQEIFR